MEKYINTMKNVAAYASIVFIMIGGCLADSESLIPTLLFVGLGGLFILIHKQIEKAQEEENKSELN